MAPGAVVVLDNGGRENATVWGDILTIGRAHPRRRRHGDRWRLPRYASVASLGYPIFSRSYSMRTGKDRVQVEAMDGTVNIGDARVDAGDILRGDADGVIVIPQAHEDAILTNAEQIDAAESQIRALVNDGNTLTEARAKLGYHKLQTKR